MSRPKSEPGKLRDRRFWIRINEEEEGHLERVAKELELNKSEAIRVLIQEAESILFQTGKMATK